MTERVTYNQASAALARFRELERISSDIDAMWAVLTADRERAEAVEKALSPSADERDDLTHIIRNAGLVFASTLADRILTAGYHRPDTSIAKTDNEILNVAVLREAWVHYTAVGAPDEVQSQAAGVFDRWLAHVRVLRAIAGANG